MLDFDDTGDIDYGELERVAPKYSDVPELREILTSSATDLGSGGYDHTFGHGLVNAEAAIRRTHALAQNPDLASLWSHQDFLA